MIKPLSTPYVADIHTNIILYSESHPTVWDTSELFKQIAHYEKVHPITKTPLTQNELDYIGSVYSFMNIVKNTTYNPTDIYKNFVKNDGFLDIDELGIARAYLQPYHFADHFKNYDEITDIERYERLHAVRQLSTGSIGDWVLRYSSMNRPQLDKHQVVFNKLMLKYYVISFNTINKNKKVVSHLLLLHRPGYGWAQIIDVTYNSNDITPCPPKNSNLKYYTCFVDLLLAMLRKYHFILSFHYPNYVDL